MTINEVIAAINARTHIENGYTVDPSNPPSHYFVDDFAGTYDISNTEAERIAEKAANLEEFEAIWENETFWRDEA